MENIYCAQCCFANSISEFLFAIWHIRISRWNNITLRLAMQSLRSGVIILSATGDTTMAAADQKIDEEKIRKTWGVERDLQHTHHTLNTLTSTTLTTLVPLSTPTAPTSSSWLCSLFWGRSRHLLNSSCCLLLHPHCGNSLVVVIKCEKLGSDDGD